MAIMDPKTRSLISYYQVLNVTPHASDDEIKLAYRNMAKRYHPDNNPQNKRLSDLRFKLINEAYSQINTQERRARYNRNLSLRAQNDNATAGQPSWLGQITRIFFPHKSSSRSS